MSLNKRYIKWICLGGTICLLAGGWWFGMPITNPVGSALPHSILICNLNNEMEVLPQRTLERPKEIVEIIESMRTASCRLSIPTLGAIGGPIVFMNDGNKPLAAFVFYADAHGMIEHGIFESNGVLHLGSAKTVGRTPFARVIKANPLSKKAQDISK